MHKTKSSYGNKIITFSAIALVIFGSLMIASAEMGNSVGDTEYLSGEIFRQVIYAIASIILYFISMRLKMYKLSYTLYYGLYVALIGALFACRLFPPVGGAYAWIRFAGFTVQPSEFAKVFMILFGAKLLGKDHKEKNYNNLIIFGGTSIFCALVIFLVQNDFGSAFVLAAICYFVALVPTHKETAKIRKVMLIILIAGLAFIPLIFTGAFSAFLKKLPQSYMVGRFLAAADPFLYRYDNGYHVIMALVSFANGGIFGLGYGNSIHKYMNFPNPSNDFILPVIVEELGIIGFAGLLIGYCLMLIPLMRASFKAKYLSSKLVYIGVFTYFVVHFILNVGGVSAFIPLTGVPLLLISSGGSSLVASMMGLGFAQSEIIRNRKIDDEDNSR